MASSLGVTLGKLLYNTFYKVYVIFQVLSELISFLAVWLLAMDASVSQFDRYFPQLSLH